MSSYAVLIDAGFLKRKLGSRSRPMDSDHVERFVKRLCLHRSLANRTLYRIYYYDAPPLESPIDKPLKGGRLNLGETALSRRNKSLLTRIAKLPYFSLRLGELTFRGWNIPSQRLPNGQDSVTLTQDHLIPNIQQKGVDMRIGLDIASLALKQHVDVIVLVTGDSDFVPAMKFARREGAQLYLVTMGHSVREPMYEHADLVLSLEGSG
ncbi:MAG: NYN domain-containing protein [Candidatus Thiosymbion ectosymbiont of Robbea hypermnestra]|nr:NYN domain-containing protein [Candidatus Thiosymbion ectosymbiont of Robbea hypermnestra]